MAHTKAKGSTKLGRESESKRLGVKVNHNEAVKSGEIIIRQRGTKYGVGQNVARGRDDTLYAKQNGFVQFHTAQKVAFNGQKRHIKVVSVVSARTSEVKSEAKPKAKPVPTGRQAKTKKALK